MKLHANLKPKGISTRVNNQHVIFELKQRVILALNKVSDRDTYEIGVDELGRIIENLTPEGISPFLSYILDTDSEQKVSVRKECIKLIGTLTNFHHNLIIPHLSKMVNSIVKRLKDPDSVVRNACIETMGILASKFTTINEPEGSFVILVRPLFEALGEQNKHVQFGSALCLSCVIDHTRDPPSPILQRMLIRTTKMLKNPHFMAKPAIIELNRSIIQGGGASTQNMLTAAMSSIQEALKNSDWRTRKAASEALAEIASSCNGSYSVAVKSSCIRSLELCRFDKVKPVRDSVLQALQLWKVLLGTDASEISETGSSIKGDYSDIPSNTESTSIRKRVPLSVRKTGQSYVESPQNSKANDWHVEVNIPKKCNLSLAYIQDEESEGSSVTKTFERTRSDLTSPQDLMFEYVPLDDKQECSSATNISLVPITGDLNSRVKGELVKSHGGNLHQVDEEISIEEKRYFSKNQERRSLDSTVTESSCRIMHGESGSCVQIAKDMVCIREKLLEIETKQSNLLDLLQLFASKTMDSLTTIQQKVSTLEDVVDQLSENINHGSKPHELTTRLLKKSSTTASPRLSTCTPRSSIDIPTRKSPLQPLKKTDSWEDSTSKSSVVDPTVRISRNPVKSMQKSGPTSFANFRHNSLQVENSICRVIKGYLSQGDFDSAYVEGLNSGDEMMLVDLLDKTGPVLECLSNRTANDVLTTLASFLSEQQFMSSIIPWLQQAVDLSSGHGPNNLVLTAKTRRQFLGAIQEAVHMEFPNATERRSVTQLVSRLHQAWGK